METQYSNPSFSCAIRFISLTCMSLPVDFCLTENMCRCPVLNFISRWELKQGQLVFRDSLHVETCI